MMENILDKRGIYFAVVVLICTMTINIIVMKYGNESFHPIVFIKPLLQNKLNVEAWYLYALGAYVMTLAFLISFNPFKKKNIYGNARLANISDIKKMGLMADRGIILGKIGNQYIRTNEPLSMVVAAPPGTGKTAAIIIPTLLSCGNSMLINDVKGELYAKTSERRKTFSKVYMFSPASDNSAAWNPLSKNELPKEWSDKTICVDRLAGALISQKDENDKGDKYFINEAKTIFTFVGLLQIFLNGETSIPEIYDIALAQADFQAWVAETLDTMGEDLPLRIRQAGNSIIQKADKEFSGVFGSFNERMNVFSDDRVRKNLASSDFMFSELRKERITIYVTIKNSDQDRLRGVLNLFFEYASISLIDKEPDDNDYTVTFVLDEFPRLGKMPSVHSAPAISRSYRYNTIFVLQTEAQARSIYGENGLDELKNTCAYQVIFSQNDLKIAKNISDAIGDKTRRKTSDTESHKGGPFSGSTNKSQEAAKLFKPQDILSFPEGEMLILKQYAFETPIKAKAAYWFKDNKLKELVTEVNVNI